MNEIAGMAQLMWITGSAQGHQRAEKMKGIENLSTKADQVVSRRP
jgi:hypothetical protein